jgi:hypothetical protein
MNLLPIPSSMVNFYPFMDGGVLYLNGSRRIWGLNSMAAFIWCLLNEVGSIEEIASRLASAFHIDISKALQNAKETIACFEREGLFSAGQKFASIEKNDSWDMTPTGPVVIGPESWALRQFFKTANHGFEFCCTDSSLGKAILGYLSYFLLDNEVQCDTRIAILPAKGSTRTWDLYVDDLRFRKGLHNNEVLPHIATLLFVHACEALVDHLLFHAAVLGKDGTTIMFPGEAGSGKTTLAAALMRHGWQYFSDEIAALNVESLCVSPLPLPMSIKPGSVRPLSRYYPGLSERPVHQRSDGKKVRYLSPSVQNLAEAYDISAPVNYLVFPKYRDDAETRLDTLDKIGVMQRLATTGSSNRDITNRDVEAMITLIEMSPCYEIVYSDLPKAVALLENLVFKSCKREN